MSWQGTQKLKTSYKLEASHASANVFRLEISAYFLQTGNLSCRVTEKTLMAIFLQ